MRHILTRSTGNMSVRLTRTGSVVVLCLLLVLPAAAQTSDTVVVRSVELALSRGDAATLLRHAADRIEIAVLGTSTLYSKAQATYVLEEFFRAYPPSRFDAAKPGGSAGNFFVSGRYWYGSEDRYLDLYMRFRSRDGACEVRELRIERPVR